MPASTNYTASERAFRDVTILPTLKVAQITGTAAAAAKLTLPAPGSGLYHYICGIEISRAATSAVAGSALLSITTTNLNDTTDAFGTPAQGTITMSGVAIANETFVIGSQTFTWKAARAATGEVTIGASAAAACTNIIAAVNADITNAVASQGAGTTVIITAASGGTAGNSIVFTEASTNMAVDGSGTLGATNSGGQGLTWTTANLIAAGERKVDVNFVPPFAPLKSVTANTATTITLPAPGAAVTWDAKVLYFIAP